MAMDDHDDMARFYLIFLLHCIECKEGKLGPQIDWTARNLYTRAISTGH